MISLPPIRPELVCVIPPDCLVPLHQDCADHQSGIGGHVHPLAGGGREEGRAEGAPDVEWDGREEAEGLVDESPGFPISAVDISAYKGVWAV